MCVSRVPRQATKLYLDALLPPVLHCLDDPESRVRYYACESLYNIAKVRSLLRRPKKGALCIGRPNGPSVGFLVRSIHIIGWFRRRKLAGLDATGESGESRRV